MARQKPKTRTKMKLRRGDRVVVISGKDKGKEGEIVSVNPISNRVVVKDINIMTKTKRPTQNDPSGGFEEREAAIHASNVQIIDPQTKERSRIGYRTEDGKKIRISKVSGANLDK